MPHVRLAVPILAVVLAASAASGCGSSKSESTTAALTKTQTATTTTPTTTKSSAPLSRHDLIAKADPICALVVAKIHASGSRTPQEIAVHVPELAAFKKSAILELSKLVPPASLAKDWQLILDDAQVLTQDTVKLGQYAQEEHLDRARPLLVEARRIQQQVYTTAKHVGLHDCAEFS